MSQFTDRRRDTQPISEILGNILASCAKATMNPTYPTLLSVVFRHTLPIRVEDITFEPIHGSTHSTACGTNLYVKDDRGNHYQVQINPIHETAVPKF